MGGDTGLREGIAEPELDEFADGGGLKVDADPERREFAHRLIEADLDAGLMQAERKAQPADAASDDDDFHLLHFAATRGSLILLNVANSTLRSSPSTFSTFRM